MKERIVDRNAIRLTFGGLLNIDSENFRRQMGKVLTSQIGVRVARTISTGDVQLAIETESYCGTIVPITRPFDDHTLVDDSNRFVALLNFQSHDTRMLDPIDAFIEPHEHEWLGRKLRMETQIVVDTIRVCLLDDAMRPPIDPYLRRQSKDFRRSIRVLLGDHP